MAKIGSGGGEERRQHIKQEQTSTGQEVRKAKQKLYERGKQIEQLADKTGDLSIHSDTFGKLCEQLARQEAQKAGEVYEPPKKAKPQKAQKKASAQPAPSRPLPKAPEKAPLPKGFTEIRPLTPERVQRDPPKSLLSKLGAIWGAISRALSWLASCFSSSSRSPHSS